MLRTSGDVRKLLAAAAARAGLAGRSEIELSDLLVALLDDETAARGLRLLIDTPAQQDLDAAESDTSDES